MSVNQRFAERLISHAKGVAVDILFQSATNIDHAPLEMPSGELLVSRWSALPATTAATLAKAIVDPVVLDQVAAREKRKTVRIELARNRRLHPVTRMYFLQEGYRQNDYDLIRATVSGMSPAELLGYIAEKDPAVRYSRTEDVARSMLEGDHIEVFADYAKVYDADELARLCTALIAANPTKALDFINRSGVEIPKLDFDGQSRFYTSDVNVWKSLYQLDPQSCRSAIVRALDDELAKLVEIDPSLLRDVVGRRRTDLESAKLFFTHDLLTELIRSGCRIDGEAVDWLIENVDNDVQRVQLILGHPDPVRSATYVVDHRDLAGLAVFMSMGDQLVKWLNKACGELGLQRSVEILEIARAKSTDTITSTQIASIAEGCQVGNDDVIAALSDALFEKIENLPVLAHPEVILDRASRLDNLELRLAVASSVIRSGDSHDASMQRRVATIALEANRIDLLSSWLSHANTDTVQPFVVANRALVAELVAMTRELQRCAWASDLIDLMVPRNGWGSVTHDSLIAAAMSHLDKEIGDDRKVWEAVLTLFETWVGTLDDLVNAARHI